MVSGFTAALSGSHLKAPGFAGGSLLLQNKLIHDGCPVLGWMASNVVAHLDAKDNIYPRKERPENKIDGIVALIMGISRAITPGTNVVLGADYELVML